METYRVALAHLDDPIQVRTGSALEAASLECVAHLRTPLAPLAESAEPDATRDEVIAHGPLLQIPAVVLMGHSMPDAYFPMICWNAAGSRQDGVISPYRAASMITYAGYYRPAEELDLLAAMHELRERYEDSPDHRPAVAAEITTTLDAWLAHRPGR